MSEELEVLKLVTHKLNHAKINYMISGSIAVNYYAIPRMTRDIDIVIEFNLSDINRFIELFQDDFYLDDEVIKTEIPRKGMFNLIKHGLGTPPSGIEFNDAFRCQRQIC